MLDPFGFFRVIVWAAAAAIMTDLAIKAIRVIIKCWPDCFLPDW